MEARKGTAALCSLWPREMLVLIVVVFLFFLRQSQGMHIQTNVLHIFKIVFYILIQTS